MSALFCNIKAVYIKLLLLPILLLGKVSFAQENFKGLLINKLDSSFVPFATVFLHEPMINVVTDNKGQFSCTLPSGLKQVTMTIAAIGCKTTITYNPAFTDLEKIYVELIPGSLNEVTVVGIGAEEVVKRAVASIHANYMNESYYAFSFYRQYQCINNVFMNLMEAQPVVMFVLSDKNDRISARERFSAAEMRKTTFRHSPDMMYENYLARQLNENPVYHLGYSSLTPEILDGHNFMFDSANSTSADYIVDYTSPHFSSEHHGVNKYGKFDFYGESWETGTLVIDKKTYAIKMYRRLSYRYPEYNYPNQNNLVQPTRDYYIEFVKAQLDVYYVPFNGKWYLKKIAHEYTNEFVSAGTRNTEYTITDKFEWYATAILNKDEKRIPGRFYDFMPNKVSIYDATQWDSLNHPFYFDSAKVVLRDLGRMGPLDEQFTKEGLRR